MVAQASQAVTRGVDQARRWCVRQLRDPRHPGGGGSYGTGGGLIRIVTGDKGSVVIHGTVKANGCDHVSGAGAGGGVFIQTPSFGGSGRIEAFGGGSSASCGEGCVKRRRRRWRRTRRHHRLRALEELRRRGIYSHVDVSGGTGATGVGGAGTLFLQASWTLTVTSSCPIEADAKWSTPLLSVGVGSTHQPQRQELPRLNNGH